MKRATQTGVIVLLTGLAAMSVGCRSLFNISLMAVEKPMRLAMVTENPAELVNPFSPYDPLLDALSAEIDQRVRLEPAFPFQVGPQLASGSYKLALATPAQYAQFPNASEVNILAIAADSAQHQSVPALLIVAVDSPIQTVADLRGKRVAFGAEDNSRSYHAARRLLRDNDLKRSDLAPSPVVLETFRFSQRSAVARTQLVLEDAVDAAFIDLREWESFPVEETGGSEPCQSKLRIVAQTVAVPDLMLLASPMLPADVAADIQQFLFAIGDQRPDLFSALPYAGFWPPTDSVVETCNKLREVINVDTPTTQPATTQPATDANEAATSE